MRHYRFALILLIAVTFPLSALYGTDLRGRIDGFNPFTNMPGPLPGIVVTLFAVMPDGQFTVVRQGVTGPDGMYYLLGVYPGQYVLQIAGVNYPLSVGAFQLQDIPIIRR